MTNEERLAYRKQMIAEDSKEELANNCRLAIDRFFTAFKPTITKEVGTSELLIALAPLIAKGVNIEFADNAWRVYDLEYAKSIREFAWWKEGKGGLDYELNYHDCDDYAELSKALFAMFGLTNSVGRCKGIVTFNGQNTYHAFDIILAIDENVIKPYLFDTQFNIPPTLLTSNKGTVNQTSWTITNIRI